MGGGLSSPFASEDVEWDTGTDGQMIASLAKLHSSNKASSMGSPSMSVRVSHCLWKTTEVTVLTQELFKHDVEAQSG